MSTKQVLSDAEIREIDETHITHWETLRAIESAALAKVAPASVSDAGNQPIGQILSESEMFEAKVDRKCGNVIWWNKPKSGLIYAAPTQSTQQPDAGELPKGWRLTEKATCYTLTCGNQCIANLVGPDARANAAKLSRALDVQTLTYAEMEEALSQISNLNTSLDIRCTELEAENVRLKKAQQPDAVDPVFDDVIRGQAELAVSNGECAAQVEMQKGEPREAMVRNVFARMKELLRLAYAAPVPPPQVAPVLEPSGNAGELPQVAQHTDGIAVDRFAVAMKSKLAEARAKGRNGWEECNPADLSRMLRQHVDKGDPRDVANFCMFLWVMSESIAPPQVAQGAGLEVFEIKLNTFAAMQREIEAKGITQGRVEHSNLLYRDLMGLFLQASAKHRRPSPDAADYVIAALQARAVASTQDDEREQFESAVFTKRYTSSIKRVTVGASTFLQSVDCPTKEKFLEKGPDGYYLEVTLNPAWWAWKTCAQYKRAAATSAQAPGAQVTWPSPKEAEPVAKPKGNFEELYQTMINPIVPELDDVTIERGLKAQGITVWGPRAEDWTAGAIFGVRLASYSETFPMQPIITTNGNVFRFKENRIVKKLLDLAVACGHGMNEIGRDSYTDEERMQFAQLIGYSLGGYADLSYVTDESYHRAEAANQTRLAKESK